MANTTKTKLDLEKENNELKESLVAMQQQMATMLEQMSALKNNRDVATITDISRKKVDVVCLMDCQAILSTGLHGSGTVYQFAGYGSVRKIRFSDLEKIVNVTKQIAFDVGVDESFFERGSFYIADSDVVEELGLGQAYEKILDKSKIDKMIALKDHSAVEIFKGANKSIKDNVVSMIVEKYNSGNKYDRNLLQELSNEYGRDIIDLADKAKAVTKSKEK